MITRIDATNYRCFERLGVTFAAQDIYDHLGYEPDVFLEKPIQPTLLRRAAEKLLGMEKE